eukprot:TRINITY_DN20030_c0_g1_i1.p1 TRINITY_DN20030_c0_g1~~TRINITY_DN20030_c0_g1_i1.p1  ORF type:complete len:188 (-),score=4.97 TRINITY_DN20030_c0_g1_i1:125-631(-)
MAASTFSITVKNTFIDLKSFDSDEERWETMSCPGRIEIAADYSFQFPESAAFDKYQYDVLFDNGVVAWRDTSSSQLQVVGMRLSARGPQMPCAVLPKIRRSFTSPLTWFFPRPSLTSSVAPWWLGTCSLLTMLAASTLMMKAKLKASLSCRAWSLDLKLKVRRVSIQA